VTRELDRIAAVGLAEPPGADLGAVDWDAVVRDTRDERIEALVGVALARSDATVPALVRADVQHAWSQRMESCLHLERLALDVASRLDEAKAEFRIVKGTAAAHLDYPDPSWRGFGDVDVLVRGDHYDRAVAALCAAGARRRSAEIRPGFDRRYGKGVCLIRDDGAQIDVHRTLASGPFGMTIDADELFGAPVWFRVGDVELPALPREQRFLHACVHAVLGDSPPRLAALRDVAQIGSHPTLDLEVVNATATRWRIGVVVARAVDEAWCRFDLAQSDLVRWARVYRPSRFEDRALLAYIGPDRSYARQMVAAVGAVPGARAKARYVRTMLGVDRGYVGAHDGSYLARVRRAIAARPGARR